MALPKLPVAFNWSGLKTSAQARALSNGELRELVNWRRTVDGALRKRLGYDRTTISSFSGGTYLGPPSEVVAAPALTVRDSVGAVFTVDGATGYYRGTDRRATPSWFQTHNEADQGRACKPLSVFAGGNLWEFSLGAATVGGTGYQVTVLDPSTKTVHRETEVILAANIVMYAVTVDLSGNVWLFYIAHSALTTVIAHKFATVTGAPTITTYSSALGDSAISIDAITLAAGTVVVGVATCSVSAGVITTGHWISKANLTTGASSSAATYLPASVPDTRTRVKTNICVFGDGVNGNVYVAYWIPRVSADDYATLQLHAHVVSSLARTTTDLANVSQNGLNPDPCFALASAYHDTATGYQNVYGCVIGDPSAGNLGDPVTVRYTYIGGGTTLFQESSRADYPASRPFLYAGNWYIVTGFDDDRYQRVQRGYYVRNATLDIVSTILDGEGAAIMHAGGLADPGGTADPYVYNPWSTHLVQLAVSGTHVYGGFLSEGFTSRDPRPTVVDLDFAAPYRSDLPGVITGGVPKFVSATDQLRELAPLVFPHRDLFDTNVGAENATPFSTNVLSFAYGTIASNGAITESAPRAEKTIVFNQNTTPSLGAPAYQLAIPTNRHVIGESWIFLYGSPNGATDQYLQATVLNDPTVDYVYVVVFPASWDDAGPLLYSLGAALEYQAPPACRLATYWRGRPWLWGTPDEQIWPGFEDEIGLGYRFSAVLSFMWKDGIGRPAGFCPAGWDALVVFKEDAVGLVSGPGPDGLGVGGYQVQTLTTKKGLRYDTPGAALQGPAGVYFQNRADGRMNLVSGGSIVEIAQGQEAFTAYVVTHGLHDEAKRELLFYCTNGKILVLDYAHPLADQPAGQWSVRESGGLVATTGARLIGGSPVHVDAAGTSTLTTKRPGIGFTDDGNQILRSMETGDMTPAGLMGEFDIDTVALSTTDLGGTSVWLYTLTDARGTTEVHADAANTTDDVEFRSALSRTRTIRLRAVEVSATGEGRQFDGVNMIVRPYGRIQNPYRRIS